MHKLASKLFPVSFFKELLELLSWKAQFPEIPKEAFQFKDT